jgi:hypothetical protein
MAINWVQVDSATPAKNSAQLPTRSLHGRFTLYYASILGITESPSPLRGEVNRASWQFDLKPSCSRREQRIHIDIDLARRPDVTDLESVGLKDVLHEADLLDADHFLFFIGNDEA